jgi:hypothetical protein
MKKAFWLTFAAILAMGFALGGQSITVTAPAAGSEWLAGSSHAITWTSSRVAGPLSIKLRRAGAPDAPPVLDIAASTENDGTFSWTIPSSLAAGSYLVRVRTVSESPLVYGDSADFRIAVAMQRVQTTVQAQPAALVQVLTMAVNFHTKWRHRERHSLHCLATMGMGPGDLPPSDFLVGFYNRCADRGALCADECVSEIYRASPVWDAARLRPLIGKNIVEATLKFRYVSTECSPHCATGLDRVAFSSGPVGDWNTHWDEVRPLAAPISTGVEYRISVTEMMRNWLREEAPDYSGTHHNYHMEFIGPNESMDFNNQKCRSRFDSGVLEIKYR